MRFLEILFLLAFCLVVAKANDEEIDTSGEKDPVYLDGGDDSTAAEAGCKEDVPEEDVRRQIKPPYVRVVSIPLVLPGDLNNGVFFRTCYCFRRICPVPGMYPGFKGWRPSMVYKSGYVVVGNYLYRFYRCDPKPLPTKPLPTKPLPTRLTVGPQ